MRETKEQLREILDMIESEEERGLQEGMSIEQVKAILLGKDRAAQTAGFRTENLQAAVRILRRHSMLDYYLPLPEERSLHMKLANFIKRVVRKMIRPIMLPIVDQQNRFNSAAVSAISDLYEQQVKLIAEHKAMRQLLVSLNRELNESRDGEDEE